MKIGCENMNMIKKISSWIIAGIISGLAILLLIFFQIEHVVFSSTFENSIQPDNYSTMFQAIKTTKGTLFYEIDTSIKNKSWIQKDTTAILGSDTIKRIVSFVLNHHKEEQFDQRIPKNEIMDLLLTYQDDMQKDFGIVWDVSTKPDRMQELCYDIYTLIDSVPIDHINLLLELQTAKTLLPPILKWGIIGIMGGFILILIFLQPSKNFFPYFLLPCTISTIYSYFFIAIIQLIKQSYTGHIDFIYQMISTTLDEILTWSGQISIFLSILTTLIFFITFITKLWPQKKLEPSV